MTGASTPATLYSAADSFNQGGAAVFGLTDHDVGVLDGLMLRYSHATEVRDVLNGNAEPLSDDRVEVEFNLDHDGRYHRVQVDGSDLISIEDQGDGTAFVMVFASTAENADPVWDGAVRIDGHFTTPEGS